MKQKRGFARLLEIADEKKGLFVPFGGIGYVERVLHVSPLLVGLFGFGRTASAHGCLSGKTGQAFMKAYALLK